MANEIHADYAPGQSVYAVIRDSAGGVWCAAERTFESWGTSGHTAGDYALPLADKGGSRYVGNFDAGIPSGQYRIQLFVRAGASPAAGDAIVASRDIVWTGRGELTPLKVLANKTVQDHEAGTLDYYDDDNQTVVFTHRIRDDGTISTRTIE